MMHRPGLDRLASEVRAAFLANAADLDFRLRTGGVEGHRPSVIALAYLRSGDTLQIDAAVRELHRVVANHRSRDMKALESSATRIAAEIFVAPQIAKGLVHLVRWFEWTAVDALVRELLTDYTDADVATLLVELYHIGYDEFDPDALATGLDYNADDSLPIMCETPHNHLADLIVTAVTARLMKNHGRELLLAWVEGSEATAS